MDEDSLSAFDLYKSRIAQYICEQSLEQEACVALLPEAERAKLTDFIRDFQEKHSTQGMKRLNRFFDELKPYEYYKMDDIGHYFIKNYDRGSVRFNGSRGEDRNLAYAAMRAQTIENPDPAKINGHTACDSVETVQNVLYAYFHLGEVRNKISHADSSAMAERRLIVSESDVSYAMIMMRESIELFITSFEKALEEVRDKKPNIVAISPDDVRNAADRIRRGNNQDRHQSDRRQN